MKHNELTINMHVRFQNDHSGKTFSDLLLAIRNEMFPVDSIKGRIGLPPEFCNLATSKNDLVEKIFPNILTNYKNHKWLSERGDSGSQEQRHPRNQQYYSDQDSRSSSHLQVS